MSQIYLIWIMKSIRGLLFVILGHNQRRARTGKIQQRNHHGLKRSGTGKSDMGIKRAAGHHYCFCQSEERRR